MLGEFSRCYREQYGVALFSSIRYEIEGNGGPQAQLLHRKVRAQIHLPPSALGSPIGMEAPWGWERSPEEKVMEGVCSPRGSPEGFLL